MNKVGSVLLVVAFACSTLAAVPAAASEHRPKDKEKFTARGEILLPGTTFITLFDWADSCPDLPATQGISAYVVPLPARFAKGGAVADVTGGGVGVEAAFRLWFFSKTCEAGPCCMDPPAVVPRYTGFIYITKYLEAATTFELTVTQ